MDKNEKPHQHYNHKAIPIPPPKPRKDRPKIRVEMFQGNFNTLNSNLRLWLEEVQKEKVINITDHRTYPKYINGEHTYMTMIFYTEEAP